MQNVGVNYIAIKWKAPVLHPSHHAPIIEYGITYCLEDTPFEKYEALESSITPGLEWRILGLYPSVAYKIRVRCRSVSGWSAWSAWVVGKTSPSQPDAPDPVEIIKVSINSILLRWQPPLRNNGLFIDHYELEIRDKNMIDDHTIDAHGIEDVQEYPPERVDHRKMIKLQKANKDSAAENSIVSKLHRVLRHKDIDQLFR